MKEDDKKIEDLFKKEFENFEPEVSSNVWKNIQIGLKGFGLGILIKVILNKIGTSTIIAIASSVVTIISTVMVMHWSGSAKNTTPAEPKTVTTVEKPVVNEPVASNKEETKPVSTPIKDKETVIESNAKNEVGPIKTNKKEIESVINKFSDKPVADIYASPVAGEVPLIVSLMNSGTGKVNKWTYGDSKVVETETSPVHIYNEPGTYKVKLTSTNAEGKTTIDSVTIEVVGNPSMTSTPPKDFSKKSLPLKLSDTKNMINMHTIIFDKGGNIVYESDEIDPQWNGKNTKGQEVKEGLYFFILNAESTGGKKYERNGSVNLTR
jgi:PKD repeat protein